MGDPTYEARRQREQQAAELRQLREAMAEEVALLFLESVKGFLDGKAAIVLDEIKPGQWTARFAANA